MRTSIAISNSAVKRIELGELRLSMTDVVGRKSNIPGIARLVDRRNRFIAMAFLSPGSRYYLRIISRSDDDIDREFWRRGVRKAYERRSGIEKMSNSFRVIHSESDGIPSVVLDKYNDIWSLQITSSGAETIENDLKETIAEEYHPSSIIKKNNSQIRKIDGLTTDDVILMGSKTRTSIREHDQNFELDVMEGQKTGAYLDYRRFRIKARELAFGDCLDAFCYQGWFACQIAQKASSVVCVDASAVALKAAEKNARINGHENIEFVKADAFDYLDGCGRRFDFIHLDPPSFAKGRGKGNVALLGYRRLLRGALKLLKSGGILFVSSCSHAITEGALGKIMEKSVAESPFTHEYIYRGIQDADHPVLMSFPESLYLKAIAVRCA